MSNKKNPNTPRNFAATNGLVRFIGGDCIKKHGGERYTKGGTCVQCVADARGRTLITRNRSNANCERALAARANKQTTYVPYKPCRHGHALRFIESNNCVECDQFQRRKHVISAKKSRIKKEYGLTHEQHVAIFQKQIGLCAICAEPFVDLFSAHVDHCHSSGKVRGLLCLTCNAGLGSFGDRILLLVAAQLYLEQPRCS